MLLSVPPQASLQVKLDGPAYASGEVRAEDAGMHDAMAGAVVCNQPAHVQSQGLTRCMPFAPSPPHAENAVRLPQHPTPQPC